MRKESLTSKKLNNVIYPWEQILISSRMDAQLISDLFMIFNVSGDGSMSKQEFVYCWNGWIKKIVRPRTAIIIVDVQNDFISGSLAVINCPAAQNGEEVKLIN